MQTPTHNLTVSGIVQNGFIIGLKNAASLLGAVFLWALTVWIPYLNVGTTIGLLGLVAAMSRGQVISPTEIFNASYRKQMGEFFLVSAFMYFGIFTGILFLIIPGLVIAMAWGLAPLLVIDMGLNPTEALQRSNTLTSGKKWKIFFGTLLTSLTISAVVMLLSTLGMKIHAVVGALLALAGVVVSMSVGMGAQAYIYGTLTGVGPGEKDEVKPGPILGGSLAALVVSLVLVGVIGGPSKPPSNIAVAPPPPAATFDLGDDADTQPTVGERRTRDVVPAGFEETKPNKRDVADSKRRNNRNRYGNWLSR